MSNIFLLIIVLCVGSGFEQMRIAAFESQVNSGTSNIKTQIIKGVRSTILNHTIPEENTPEKQLINSVATSLESSPRRFFSNFGMPLKLHWDNLLFNNLPVKQPNESIEQNDYGMLKPVVVYGKKLLDTLGHFVNDGQKFTQEHENPQSNNVNNIKTNTTLHNVVEQSHNNEIDENLGTILTHENGEELFKKFTKSMETMDRKFYLSTFTLLSANTAIDTSFVQSGLSLQLLLTALSMATDSYNSEEINELTGFNRSIIEEKIACLKYATSWLPASSDVFKMRWSSRLVLNSRVALRPLFEERVAPALRLTIHRLNNSVDENPSLLAYTLNNMVEMDSDGALRDTFDAQEVSEGVQAALLSTLYMRAAWRVAPTMLNGTWPFRHANTSNAGLPRTTKMFRLNDIVRYAYLEDWDAEAVEVPYATPGLSMLVIMARSGRLRELAAGLEVAGLQRVLASLQPRRVAVTLPLYTLRMGLLLPSKLKFMGVSRIWLDTKKMEAKGTDEFRISHAVQRIMFWGDTGRNAFKDDGLVWEEPPELNLTMDRPYVFFVRWHGVTLLNGNLAL